LYTLSSHVPPGNAKDRSNFGWPTLCALLREGWALPLIPGILKRVTGRGDLHFILRFPFCHPERSDPIFSSPLNCGASGRVVEGSLRLPTELLHVRLVSPARASSRLSQPRRVSRPLTFHTAILAGSCSLRCALSSTAIQSDCCLEGRLSSCAGSSAF
jgi:hypothetical protein